MSQQNKYVCRYCGNIVTRSYRSSSPKRYFCTKEGIYRNKDGLRNVGAEIRDLENYQTQLERELEKSIHPITSEVTANEIIRVCAKLDELYAMIEV